MYCRKLVPLLFFLIFALLFSSTSLAVQDDGDSINASSLISNTSASAVAKGSGQVKFQFTVYGRTTLDMIGALQIRVYKSDGTPVATYSYLSYPNLMNYNTDYHGSSVTYSGVSGQSYYAKVSVYVRSGSNSDNRTIYSNTVTA